MLKNSSSLAKIITDEIASDEVKNFAQLIIENTDKQSSFIKKFINFLKEEENIHRQEIRVISIEVYDLEVSLHENFRHKLKAKKLDLIIKKKY